MELEKERKVAEEADRAKSVFLAMMSHELRTPVNAIGGYVQLIEMGVHGPVTEAQGAALERIAKAQQHLLRLINVLPMVDPQLAARRIGIPADRLGLHAGAAARLTIGFSASRTRRGTRRACA